MVEVAEQQVRVGDTAAEEEGAGRIRGPCTGTTWIVPPLGWNSCSCTLLHCTSQTCCRRRRASTSNPEQCRRIVLRTDPATVVGVESLAEVESSEAAEERSAEAVRLADVRFIRHPAQHRQYSYCSSWAAGFAVAVSDLPLQHSASGGLSRRIGSGKQLWPSVPSIQ